MKYVTTEGFFMLQGQTAHWSYAATLWLAGASVRILDRNEVVYSGLAHRHRAIVTPAPFAVAADVLLVLARRVPRARVRRT
jgi:hypothetical protein